MLYKLYTMSNNVYFFSQMLKYEGRCAQILDNDATTVKMVDDCGNCWDCVLMFGLTPYEHCKIGREWKRFVEARL